MRCLGCLATTALCGIAVSAAIFADPALFGQAAGAVGGAVSWVSSEMSHLTSPSTSPNPAPAPITFAPAAPSTSPEMSPGMSPLFTPPAPPPVAISKPVSWAPADCTWAQAQLAADYNLDTGASTGPLAAYYRDIAAQWSQAYDAVTFLCGQRPLAADAAWMVSGHQLTVTGCSTPQAWYMAASATHVADERVKPQDAWWDRSWEQTYARLGAMWEAACA